MKNGLDPTEIWMAYDLVERAHRKTPLIPFGVSVRGEIEVDFYVKMDTTNPGGSFKDRGSLYFISKAYNSGRLKDRDTVVTASAGNHAKGVARAASNHNLNSVIYMSNVTPKNKINGTRELGAEVRLVEGDYHTAADAAKRYSLSSYRLKL